MKLLFIGNYLTHITGAYSVSQNLAQYFSDKGHQIKLTSTRSNKGLRLLDMIITSMRQAGSIDCAHVDVFSGPAFFWAETCCFILRMNKKPYVLTLHGGNLPSFSRKNKKRVTRLLASAAQVTTPSTYLIEMMSPFRQDIRIIPNPIDVHRFSFRLRDHVEPNLLWVRAFHKIYNPALAVKIIALLEKKFPSIKLTMVGRDKGDGSFQEVQQLVSKLGVEERVSFFGGVENQEIPAIIDRSDIFINTTNYDNMPVSIMEAMAGGMCVVSTSVGGIPYMLKNEVDALLVEPDNPEAMAVAIERILRDTQLAGRLSQNAFLTVEKKDIGNIYPVWEALFSKLIAAHE